MDPVDSVWGLPAPSSVPASLEPLIGGDTLLGSALVRRGITTFSQARAFLDPNFYIPANPSDLPDLDKAVDRIEKAVVNNESILVFGDYDVDGTTSVATLYQFLIKLTPQVDYYIPHRYKEGYGVSKIGIDYAKETGIQLIISVDCGIKSIELVEYAKQLGIDFIICDHHLPDAILPPAMAILNPKQIDCTYPFKELCGCGVVFKLITALAEKYKLPAESYLEYLDLVATAIAADIVPIVDENRTMAFFGLQQVNEAPCPGLLALMELAKQTSPMRITNLVFAVAPRINAAGRMDDAKKAVQLFIEKDYNNALAIGGLLQQDNLDRREADTTITEEALEQIELDIQHSNKKSSVVFQPHWHKGVVGIVASRLIERHYKPTIVLTQSGDVLAGSARSVIGFNLYEALHACREHLIGYGGHFAAAGMTLALDQLEPFKAAFEREVSARITEAQLVPEIIINAILPLDTINKNFFQIITQMEPFGPDNMRPLFIAKGVYDTGYSKLMKEAHISFNVTQGNQIIKGIGYNMPQHLPIVKSGKPFDIVFQLQLNEWQGNETVQMQVLDVKEAQ